MKTLQVGEVYRLHDKASISVAEDAALDYVIALLGHEKHIQGVFMVDTNQRFAGMVSRFDVLRWMKFQLHGGKRRTEIGISDLFLLVNAKKAKDLETHDSSSFNVKENDTLQSALDLMIVYEQDIIPVLDSEGRIIGDLSLSEILSKALEVGTRPQA